MTSLRTFATFFILFCSVIHSAMAYTTYYGSWYFYVWIPFLIIAIIRCCCYFNKQGQQEPRVVYVDGVPTTTNQTVINTSQVTSGAVGVVIPPNSQAVPPYAYGQQQGAVINSAYTPGPGTAYPPTTSPQAYPTGLGAYPTNAPGAAYPPTEASTAYPPPPAYIEAVKLPVAGGVASQ